MPTTKRVTVRLPEDVRRFLDERVKDQHIDRTAVVVGALRAEMRRCEIEHEIAVYRAAGGNPYGIAPQSAEQVADVLKDLDRWGPSTL